MNQYLGREKVKVDPNASQFDPVPEGMYFVRIEGMNERAVKTKLGNAKILNPQCRVLLGENKGKVVFGTVWVYTTDDNPEEGFFDSKRWINNDYLKFIKEVRAIEEGTLESMVADNELPLLREEDVLGKFCWIVTKHETYHKSDIPEEKRTPENATTKATVQNWIDEEVGLAAINMEPDAIQAVKNEADQLPF